jgi:single-strand DNA-binding protein
VCPELWDVGSIAGPWEERQVNETTVTFVGNVATDIRSTHSRDGVPITSFRMASTTRRFERGKGWTDVDTIFVTVVCWRQLAEHLAASFSKGDPVIVTGRLRVRQWTAEGGRSGTAVELEALAAGHDLTRGVATFTRIPARVVAVDPGAGSPDDGGRAAPGDAGIRRVHPDQTAPESSAPQPEQTDQDAATGEAAA